MLAGTSGHLVVKSPLLARMMKAGYLGRKSGRGFFLYDEVRQPPEQLPPNPAAQSLIDRFAALEPTVPVERAVTGLMLPTVMEAARLLDEGRASDAGQIDLAVTCGLGFPQSRGGLLYWADMLGAAKIVEMLEPLADVSSRFQPTAALLEMAAQDGRFHSATL